MAVKHLVENVRDIALVGHRAAGKTSLADALLFEAHAVDRMGSVDDGTSVAEARKRLRLQRRRIPLEQLEGAFDNLTTAGAVVAYDESLLAVNAIFDRRRDVTWTQLLYGFSGGSSPRHTLAGFGIDYAELEAAFEK